MATAPIASASDLLSAVGRGDRKAFRDLYDLTRAKIYGVCIAMLRRRETADEAFQEVFIRIWEKADRYDAAKGDALAWMTAVARRSILDRMRRQNIVGIALDEVDPAAAELAVSSLASASGAGLDLKRCLDQLNREQSRAIVLAYLYGLTHEELASKLARPLGTVKSWVRRGLADLKECMDG